MTYRSFRWRSLISVPSMPPRWIGWVNAAGQLELPVRRAGAATRTRRQPLSDLAARPSAESADEAGPIRQHRAWATALQAKRETISSARSSGISPREDGHSLKGIFFWQAWPWLRWRSWTLSVRPACMPRLNPASDR
jgi:hypothetical protein